MGREVQVPWKTCEHGGRARAGQTVVGGQLRWYQSFSCPNCGDTEVDGVGFPPAYLRDVLLDDGGRWNLVVSEADRVAAIRVVRKALNLLMDESAAVTFRRFPVVYAGTRTEAEWLKAQMDASNLASKIVAEQT